MAPAASFSTPNDRGFGPRKKPAYRARLLGKNPPRHPLQVRPGNPVDLLLHALQNLEAGDGFESSQLVSQLAGGVPVQKKSCLDLLPGPLQVVIGNFTAPETLQFMVQHLLGQFEMGAVGKRHQQLVEVRVTSGMQAGVDMSGDLGIHQGPVQTRGSGGALLQGLQTYGPALGPTQDGVQDPQPVQIALVDAGRPKCHLQVGDTTRSGQAQPAFALLLRLRQRHPGRSRSLGE